MLWIVILFVAQPDEYYQMLCKLLTFAMKAFSSLLLVLRLWHVYSAPISSLRVSCRIIFCGSFSHMNEPILTILTSIQAVKCKTKIGLRAGMGNGGYTERVLGPIIWQSSLEIVHEPGWPRLPSRFALSACVNPSNSILKPPPWHFLPHGTLWSKNKWMLVRPHL